MTRRAPYFHVYIGLMVVFASYAMGVTMRVREARLRGNVPHGCTRRAAPPALVVSAAWKPVVEKYAGAVCLVTGTVSYFDDAGKPIRYDVKAFEERGELVWDPNGPVFAKEFKGTAFHIGNGVVLTNEVIFRINGDCTPAAERKNNFIRPVGFIIGKTKLSEAFSNVRAYFPNQPEPFHLKSGGFRLVHDVPEFTFELNGADVPALKVDDHDDRLISFIVENDRVGQKLLLLWQPAVQDVDGAHSATPAAAETAIGWNSSSTFLMKNFRDCQTPPPGTPILDEQGVVIGIVGYRTDSSKHVESELDAKGIMPRSLVVMGETYGAHLSHKKYGMPCWHCEEEKSAAPAKKSRRHR